MTKHFSLGSLKISHEKGLLVELKFRCFKYNYSRRLSQLNDFACLQTKYFEVSPNPKNPYDRVESILLHGFFGFGLASK